MKKAMTEYAIREDLIEFACLMVLGIFTGINGYLIYSDDNINDPIESIHAISDLVSHIEPVTLEMIRGDV